MIQRYIAQVYKGFQEYASQLGEKAAEATPPEDILRNAQIIHDALNDQKKFGDYLQLLNEFVGKSVEEGVFTPMRALRVQVADLNQGKLPKLFEATPSTKEFLGTVHDVKGPFHDVSAGQHHGEYEHAIQVDFIKDLYKYKTLYSVSNLKGTFEDMWKAMYNPQYQVKIEEGLTLSLWDLVLDIQGGFVTGKKGGTRKLFEMGGGEGDPYAKIFGSSATVLHNLFGAYGGETTYSKQTGLNKGDLAKLYPHIAEAIINRHLKRQSEGTSKGAPKQGYLPKHHPPEVKEERQKEARGIVGKYGGELPYHWTPPPSRKDPKLEGTLRKNVWRQ